MKNNDERTDTYLGIVSTDPDKRELRDNGILLLVEDVGETVAREFIRDLSIIKLRKNLNEITVKICCPGGSVENGMGMIRVIKELQTAGTKIIGEVYGHAMSMGFLILQACDVRIMGKGDILMAHGLTTGVHGDAKNVNAEKKIMTFMTDYFADALAVRNTSDSKKYHTAKFWKKLLEDNTPQFYSTKESLEMGLIDSVREET